MRHTLWMVAVAAVILGMAVLAAVAEESGEKGPTAEEMERFERGLEMRARESKLDHEQQVRELELEQRRAEIERLRHGPPGKHGGGGLILLIVVTNILLTVWVFKDMHEQKIGRALWVPIVLLAGIFGAILYAIVRLADTRPKPQGEV